MVEGLNFRNLAIHGVVFIENEDDLNPFIEFLNSVKNIDLPEGLDGHIVNINEEEPTDSTLIIADQLPEGPVVRQSSIDLVAISFDEDDDLSISIDASKNMLDLANEIFDEILTRKDVHILSFDMEYALSAGFSELPISTEVPERFESTGVKLVDDEHEYIIQSTDSGPWLDNESPKEKDGDKEKPGVSVHTELKQHFDVEETGDFINARKQDIEEALELFTS